MPEIVQYDSPLRYFVPSENEEGFVYLVELEPEEGAPHGACDCWEFHRRQKFRRLGSPLVTCKHIRAARWHLQMRILRGDFDDTLCKKIEA